MLKLTRKQYEVDERVVYDDEQGNILYDFNIQLTADEVQAVKKIIFDETLQEKVQKLNRLKEENKFEEYDEMTKSINADSVRLLEEFEDIVYKEHKEPFKEIAGKTYYDAMTEEIYGFFTMKFINKRLELANTMNSSLRKAGMK